MREHIEIIEYKQDSGNLGHSDITIFKENGRWHTKVFRMHFSEIDYVITNAKTRHDLLEELAVILHECAPQRDKTTLITKTGKQVNLTPPDERDISEIMEDFKMGINFPAPCCVDDYIQIEVSEDTMKFIESVANIEMDFYGDKTYVINNLRFKALSNESNKH